MAQLAVERRRKADVTPPALSSAEFNTAMAHLYRAEVTKSNVWRQRLDTTTNWAVVTSGAAISFALGDTDLQRHLVILLTSLLVTFFMLLEARRYRHYDVWQTRVHLLESHYFAPLLCPEDTPPDADWRRLLAEDLRTPAYHIPYWEALGWRLRRSYVWLYAVLLLTWLAKISLHPAPVSSLVAFVAHASIGPVHGWAVLAGNVLFHAAIVALAIATWSMHSTSGEVLTPERTRQKIRSSGSASAPRNVGAGLSDAK